MAVDFNKALDVKASDVEAVPVPPIGHYVWQITKVPEINTENRWNSVNFQCKAVSVYEDANDVDADDLKAFGKVTSIQNRKSFMFDSEEGTEVDLISFQNQVKRFLSDHVQVEGAMDMSLREGLNASVNKRFVGELTHKPDKQDPEVIRANIGRTAPL